MVCFCSTPTNFSCEFCDPDTVHKGCPEHYHKNYENPVEMHGLDEYPLISQLTDKDGETLEIEYHVDDLLIFRIHHGLNSPVIPLSAVIKTIEKMQRAVV